jgi:selenoprotein W-related protein
MVMGIRTFQDELHGVTLIPSRASPGGVFRVVAIVASPTASGASSILLWDRKEQGGFPELKQLKQRLRDVVAPEQSLGHSDTPNRTSTQAPSSEPSSSLVIDANTVNTDCVDCHSPLGHFKTGAKGTLLPQPPLATTDGAVVINVPTGTAPVPNVAITYCTGCRWLLRAAWMGQELLTTFDTQIDSLTLIPSKPPQKGGTFVSHIAVVKEITAKRCRKSVMF